MNYFLCLWKKLMRTTSSCGMLAEVARSRKVTLVGGSVPERCGSHLYSTCCVFGSDGKLKARHRKVHLFDVDIPGQLTFKESTTLTTGDELTIVGTGEKVEQESSYGKT
ncbi:hypothetical protein O6H91_Y251200 [Diphasiastrum complanatum]|nr:hypothetical protein O6H91_Y251200 [Diphasiastrum complanatum]